MHFSSSQPPPDTVYKTLAVMSERLDSLTKELEHEKQLRVEAEASANRFRNQFHSQLNVLSQRVDRESKKLNQTEHKLTTDLQEVRQRAGNRSGRADQQPQQLEEIRQWLHELAEKHERSSQTLTCHVSELELQLQAALAST